MATDASDQTSARRVGSARRGAARRPLLLALLGYLVIRGTVMLNGYLYANNQTEARCNACDSTEFKDEGLTHGKDERRIISCARCNAMLYRFNPPEEST